MFLKNVVVLFVIWKILICRVYMKIFLFFWRMLFWFCMFVLVVIVLCGLIEFGILLFML